MTKEKAFEYLKSLLFVLDGNDYILNQFIDSIEYESLDRMNPFTILELWSKFIFSPQRMIPLYFETAPKYMIIDLCYRKNTYCLN